MPNKLSWFVTHPLPKRKKPVLLKKLLGTRFGMSVPIIIFALLYLPTKTVSSIHLLIQLHCIPCCVYAHMLKHTFRLKGIAWANIYLGKCETIYQTQWVGECSARFVNCCLNTYCFILYPRARWNNIRYEHEWA